MPKTVGRVERGIKLYTENWNKKIYQGEVTIRILVVFFYQKHNNWA